MMSRTEQKHATLRNRVQGHMCSEVNSHVPRKHKEIIDIGSHTSPFRTLAENCGFKVIEEGKDNIDCFPNNDQSDGNCILATETTKGSGRWSTESCCDQKEFRDLVADTKQNGSVENSENKSQQSTVPETYLVSRICENVNEPTIDYLDMADVGDNMESCLDNVNSRKGKFTDDHSYIGPAAVQYTIKRDSQRKSVKSEKRRTRFKIMKQDISNVKSRNRNDKSKACTVWNLNNKNEKYQSHDSVVDRDCHSSLFNLPVCKANSSSSISVFRRSNTCLEDVSFEEMDEKSKDSTVGHPYSKPYNISNAPTIETVKEDARMAYVLENFEGMAEKSKDSTVGHLFSKPYNISNFPTNEIVKEDTRSAYLHENILTTCESDPESIQVFSNINSSCLRQESSEQNSDPAPNSCEEGGMLSFLRKLKTKSNIGIDITKESKESRGFTKDSHSKQVPPERRSFNITSDYKNSKSDATEKHCTCYNKDTTYVLSSNKMTCGNKTKSPSCYRTVEPQQKSSTRKLKTPRMTRAECQNNDCEKETVGLSLPPLKGTSEIPPSTIPQKGVNTTTVQPVQNSDEDYNINFNSEDDVDENTCANSFIGHYLYELWRHQCLCDVRLKVGNTSFLAHKVVLAAFSDIFCPDDPRQIPTLCFDIPDVSEEALCLILQYLYTSEMEITDSVLEAVYNAACVLEIGEITELVAEILSKPTIENFEKYMAIRQRVGLPGNIYDVYKDFICENLLDIDDSPYILNMPVGQMEKLLRDPDVKIESEEDIIRLIIKWIKFNPCQRSKHSSELLCLVNFDCVGAEALSYIVEQNRHLFDLASMDIIMAAFKDFALRCKDMPYKVADCANVKTCKTRCIPLPARNREEDNCCEIYECPEISPPDCVYGGSTREKRNRLKKANVMSPQDIRKNVTKHCWGKEKTLLQCYKNCCEAQKRNSRATGVTICSPASDTKYTIRRKKICDSSNNFPVDGPEQRSRSASSESRCGHVCRRQNSSRSDDSDTGQHTCCSTQDGHCVRKRTLPTRTVKGNSYLAENGDKDQNECSMHNVGRDRNAYDGCGLCRGTDSCHMCRRSRSSSRSSGSSQRYNASSSGSSKRVTFSYNKDDIC